MLLNWCLIHFNLFYISPGYTSVVRKDGRPETRNKKTREPATYVCCYLKVIMIIINNTNIIVIVLCW